MFPLTSVDLFPRTEGVEKDAFGSYQFNSKHVETVTLLSKLDVDQHFNIEINEEDLKHRGKRRSLRITKLRPMKILKVCTF